MPFEMVVTTPLQIASMGYAALSALIGGYLAYKDREVALEMAGDEEALVHHNKQLTISLQSSTDSTLVGLVMASLHAQWDDAVYVYNGLIEAITHAWSHTRHRQIFSCTRPRPCQWRSLYFLQGLTSLSLVAMITTFLYINMVCVI